MRKRKQKQNESIVCRLDLEHLLAELNSPDAAARAKAVRSICPCRLGWRHFEAVLGLLEQLKKDPDPIVRASAIHVFEDADEMDSSGPPTTPRMYTNSIEANRFRFGGMTDDVEERRKQKAAKKASDADRKHRT